MSGIVTGECAASRTAEPLFGFIHISNVIHERPWITADAGTSGHSVKSQRKFGCSLPSCGIQRAAERTCHICHLSSPW